MATSQNGYSANDRTLIASYTVPGTSLRIALRKGDVSVVLLDYLGRYNREVEPLTHVPQDLWGYAERTIRGDSTTLSNHASGSAVDCRATAHALGAVGTFNPSQRAALLALIASYGGVLRWGGSYVGRKDEMHAEVVGTPAQVKAVADRIRGGTPAPSPTSNSTGDWFDMATKDDLKAALHEVLDPVIWQTTGTLPNRRGPGGTELPGGGNDTLWGYAMSADGAAYRIEQAMSALAAGNAPATTVADLSTADLLAELGRRMSGAAK